MIRSVSIPTYQPRLRTVIRVIAESGAAYTTMVFMTFVVSMFRSNALYPLSDAVRPSPLSYFCANGLGRLFKQRE